MKNRFSTSKSKRHHYGWFKGGEKSNPSKVIKYKMTALELEELRKKEREEFKNRKNKNK